MSKNVKIKTCGYRILVKPLDVKKLNNWVLEIPDTAIDTQQEAVTEGELIYIGPTAWKGCDDGKPWAKLGDIVLFKKFGGMLIDKGEYKGCRTLNDIDIVAVRDGEDIIPCGRRILVEVDKEPEKSAGGIILPQTAILPKQLRRIDGRIIAMGPNVWNRKYLDEQESIGDKWADIGDRVMFVEYGGAFIDTEEHHFRLLEDEDIVAVLDDDVEINIARYY